MGLNINLRRASQASPLPCRRSLAQPSLLPAEGGGFTDIAMAGHVSLREALGEHLHSLAPPLFQLLEIPAGLQPQVSFANFHNCYRS